MKKFLQEFKVVESTRKKEEAAPPPQPSAEEKLLTEIRDILKENHNG